MVLASLQAVLFPNQSQHSPCFLRRFQAESCSSESHFASISQPVSIALFKKVAQFRRKMFEETLQNNFGLTTASPFGISSSGLAGVGAVGSIGNGIGIASQAVKPVQKEIKRPNWDRNHVTFWFRSMEAHFELDRITEERTKFLYIVASLPAAVLAQVPNESALDAQQPGCYEALKKAVIEAGPALFESTRDRRCPQCGQFPKPRFSAKGPLCWYHFNFGMMAHKCTKPTCQWLKFPEPATSAE